MPDDRRKKTSNLWRWACRYLGKLPWQPPNPSHMHRGEQTKRRFLFTDHTILDCQDRYEMINHPPAESPNPAAALGIKVSFHLARQDECGFGPQRAEAWSAAIRTLELSRDKDVIIRLQSSSIRRTAVAFQGYYLSNDLQGNQRLLIVVEMKGDVVSRATD